MPEPNCLDDGSPGCDRPQGGCGCISALRLINRGAGIVRRAIAQPAKSAVATAAIGLIVGVAVRTALFRHSAPNAAAGSVDATIDSRSADRHSTTSQPAKKRNDRLPGSPASQAPTRGESNRGEPLADDSIQLDLDPFWGDLIDDRND